MDRFGWKAATATLLASAREAYRTEMRITSPLAPTGAHAGRRGPRGEAARASDRVLHQFTEREREELVKFLRSL